MSTAVDRRTRAPHYPVNLELRDQPVLTAELGRRARARVIERYTLTRNIDALEQLYTDLTRAHVVA